MGMDSFNTNVISTTTSDTDVSLLPRVSNLPTETCSRRRRAGLFSRLWVRADKNALSGSSFTGGGDARGAGLWREAAGTRAQREAAAAQARRPGTRCVGASSRGPGSIHGRARAWGPGP